jgi:protoporphyrinogen oxidase
MEKIVIIGAGMAGIGAAYKLCCNNIGAIIFEKNNFCGGNAASFFSKEGFIFDIAPHASFTKNRKLKKLFFKSVNQQVITSGLLVNNYWKGYWIKHPVQGNLNGLPHELVKKIIVELIENKSYNEHLAYNSREWLNSVFGETFTENFPARFVEKYHTIPLENIEPSELKTKFYRPEIHEVLRGAVSAKTKNAPYTSHFSYPELGGFERFLDKIVKNFAVEFKQRVRSIDSEKKLLFFDDGRTEKYDYLISTIPLPELVKCIIGVPPTILQAARKLACTSCVIVNLGIARKNISAVHRSYFYDHDIVFSRLTFPRMFSPNNVPGGYESIQAEIYFSKKYKPLFLSPDSFITPVISGLIRCGLITDNDKVVYQEAKLISYANIIFDFDRKHSLLPVHNYLDEIGINYCGRYGEWKNLKSDEAFESGEIAAQHVIDQLKLNTVKSWFSKQNYRVAGNQNN